MRMTTEIELKWFIIKNTVKRYFRCGDFSGVRKSEYWVADPGQRVGGAARSDLRKGHYALLNITNANETTTALLDLTLGQTYES